MKKIEEIKERWKGEEEATIREDFEFLLAEIDRLKSPPIKIEYTEGKVDKITPDSAYSAHLKSTLEAQAKNENVTVFSASLVFDPNMSVMSWIVTAVGLDHEEELKITQQMHPILRDLVGHWAANVIRTRWLLKNDAEYVEKLRSSYSERLDEVIAENADG